MDRPILRFSDVSFAYESAQGSLLDGLDLEINEGEFVCVLGPNGSGKSTMLKLASGMLRPDSGEIFLWDRKMSSYTHKNRAKLLSYLPQVLDLSVPFRVVELVEMGRYPYDIPPVLNTEEAVRRMGLTEKREAYIRELSGGERRRAFLAMTLLQGAGILLLDEPLANLDVRYQMEIISLLRDTGGLTVVMAMHDINMANRFDRVILLKNGGILADGVPHDVLTEERLFEAFEVELRVISGEGRSYISY